jgi:purine-binding chemotaxis protein CheW
MGEGWERVSSGMIETEEGALLMMDVEALVAGPDAARQAA